MLNGIPNSKCNPNIDKNGGQIKSIFRTLRKEITSRQLFTETTLSLIISSYSLLLLKCAKDDWHNIREKNRMSHCLSLFVSVCSHALHLGHIQG